jgi:hypothetical protein
MSVTALLALVCIVLGFVGELVDERLLLGTLEWFIAAIAFNTLSIDYAFWRKP